MKRRLAAALAGALLGSGCAGVQSALDPQGLEASALAQLSGALTATCAVVWLIVAAVLLRAVWRRPAPRGDDPGALDPRTEQRLKRNVTLATVATAGVVLVLGGVSMWATRHFTRADADSLVIQVRAWQWWWEVRYPGARPAATVTTANEIHVPVGRRVKIELAAADVIHSFWIPNLAGKLDMIPGRATALSFTATQPGIYRGQCAEFCGLQHARMAFVVVAEAPAVFEAWRRAQLADAAAPPPGRADLTAGQRVFTTRACAACHTVRGTAAAGTLGPDLTHVGSRRTLAAGVLENTRGALAAWIADPQTVKPGNNMPRVDLSGEELNALAAYLESLR